MHSIRQVIDITDRPDDSNRNRPKDNHCHDKARRSGKPANAFGVPDPEIPPDNFGGFRCEGALELKGCVVLLGELDLCGFVGGGEGGKGDESGGDFWGAHVVSLFFRDFGVHAGQFGARVVDTVDLRVSEE